MSKPIKSTRQARRARGRAFERTYYRKFQVLPTTTYQITYTNGTVETVDAAYLETAKDGTVTFCTGIQRLYYDIELESLPRPEYTTIKVVSPNAYRTIDRL